jgi:Domain of unknown function (DUF4193)
VATNYDIPRTTEEEGGEDSLEELKARRAQTQTGSVDIDETDLAESLELPGADLSGEELTVRILPRQTDEFTCTRCFLVHHRSQLATNADGQVICRELPPEPLRRAGGRGRAATVASPATIRSSPPKATASPGLPLRSAAGSG